MGQLATALQSAAQLARFCRGFGRDQLIQVLGLGHGATEPLRHLFRPVDGIQQQGADTGDRLIVQFADGGRRLQIGIAIALTVAELLADIVGKRGHDLVAGGCPEADREGQAVVGVADAMMSDAGGQIEHVARLQHPVLVGFDGEVFQNPQIDTGNQPGVVTGRAAQLPATPAAGLQQEDIVLIDVRAHAAARRGVADHDVVEAPARYEVERFQQLGDFGHIVIHGLHQQRPAADRQARESLLVERAMADLPRLVGAMLLDQPGFDAFLAGQARQIVRLQWRDEAGQCAADQQRRFLPVLAEKLGGREAAEQGAGRVGRRHIDLQLGIVEGLKRFGLIDGVTDVACR